MLTIRSQIAASFAALIVSLNASIAAPVVFRNNPIQPVLMQEGNSGNCYGTVYVEPSRLYLTLPADQQSSATGPWIAFRRSCELRYSPFNCQEHTAGFTGPLEIRAQRHVMYPDCGNFSQPNSVQHVLFQGARLGPYNAVEWENTGCADCYEPERLVYPPYGRYDPYCNTCDEKPNYIGFAITINGAKHLGWMRYSYTRNSEGRWRMLPQAWAYESTPNVAITIPCDGDYNFDGTIDLFDYFDYVADFSAGSDLAKIGTYEDLSFFDYLDFLIAFNNPCS